MTNDEIELLALRSLVVEAFHESACRVPTADVEVYRGHLPLRHLMERHLDADLARRTTVTELLSAIGDEEPEVLIYNAVYYTAPPDWAWTLDCVRIGDRGYIVLVLDEDDVAGQPLLGSWAPFDCPAAFAACFTAVYAAELDLILFGSHLQRGPRVGQDLLQRALWAGLERADAFRWEQLREFALPLDTIAGRRAVLDLYLANVGMP